jgi:ribosomal protein S18 acetylase RimI-like enzyme
MQIKRLGAGDRMLAWRTITKLKKEISTDIRAGLKAEYLERFLRCDENYFLVALIDEEPIGFALAYRLMRVDRKQDMMLFYEIVVEGEYRNKGVGRALIHYLKSICSQNKIMKMWVSTNKSNTAAMELYASTGGIESTDGDEVSFTYFPSFD